MSVWKSSAKEYKFPVISHLSLQEMIIFWQGVLLCFSHLYMINSKFLSSCTCPLFSSSFQSPLKKKKKKKSLYEGDIPTYALWLPYIII